MELNEKILSSTIRETTSFLTLEDLTVELPNGHIAQREVVRHPGAAAVFVIDDQDRVLLVSQYRVALDRILIEIPAGKLDSGEDPLETARRELLEETGVTADSLTHMVSMATAAGFSDEIIHIYLATGLHIGEPQPDEDEFVEVSWVPLAELLNMIEEGEIIDSKTITAATFFQHKQNA